MKTAIYNKVKRLALLFVAGGAMMSSAVAQENLHLFYRNGDYKQIEITDDTQVEFVKETFLHETSFSDVWGDTIWLSASAGSSGYNGYVRSNQQWSLISDADWMIGYPVYADSLREQMYQKDDNVFYVAALPNSSAQQRTATLTLKTKDGKAQCQYTVVQQPYTMSFEYGSFINDYRYDGQPVVRDTLMLAWDDVESYHYVMPNHGVRVVSYPEWMELDTVAHRGENYDLAWQKENTTLRRSLTTVARFRFAQNFNATARTGEVVFEGSNGQRITSFVVQEGLNETSVMVTAAKLHQQLYEPNFLGNSTHNDFGLPAMMLYLDSRGADMVAEDVGYNWFSHAVRYTDTGASGYPTHIAWRSLYRNIREASSVIKQFGAQESDPILRAYLSQAYALRAFDYFYLAQIYQHTYVGNEDAPCLPIVAEDNMEQEYTAGIERASVREVYAYILENLDKAILLLEGNSIAFPDKGLISLQAAVALRARVHLVMNNWQAALNDAQQVIASGAAIPYTMEQVSKPGFNDIDDASWLWGVKVEENDNAVLTGLLNLPSHLCSMTGYGYATTDPGVQRRISKALWVSIPYTDVRKGWWVDENLQSPLLVNAYGEAQAEEIPHAANMAPYTNVKFGPYNDEPLNATNAQDIPLIRIEEMHLIVAEAQAMLGNTAEAVTTLNNFVSTYRDPAYRCTATTAEQVQEAVWQQRRIELWGEGQAYYDLMRLKKPVDRRGAGFQSSYVFNIPEGDAIRIYQLPSTEMNGNPALVQNPEFAAPQPVEDFEVEIPDPNEGQWTSLGMATYTEDLVTTFFSNVDNVSYEVEIQESVEYPGKYRLVNAYGAAYPYNSDGDYDASKNYYIVIDACNPEKVSIDLSYTGMNWGYGEFYVWSMAQYVMANGGTEADALPYWGKLENGVITFPAQALVSGMGDEYMNYGNKNGKFSVVLPGYELPQIPTELYMIGQDFGGWDWESEGVVSMTPVHSHEGAFWTTRYFTAGSGFKFCAKRAWDGDFFTLGDDYGFYTDGGNCYVEADGFYTVYVDLVNNIIAVEPAAVYGIGDCFGGWDVDVEANKFVADGRTLVSRATEYDGELRMYVDAPAICDDVEWWMMEFNIYDGAIVYRGAGFDQERVQVAANQQVVLDLNAGTGYVGVGDDFVFFSDGVYNTEFFGGAWQQVMEKSQSVPNLYRLPSYIVEGYDLRFHWDEATGAVGLDTREWETGYVHSSYGMIYAKAEDISYDAAAKTFYFTIQYFVPGKGSFATTVDTYTLAGAQPQIPTELYMIGQDFGGWDWESEGVVSMTPVHSHEGAFWTTRYFTAGSGFKFCAKRAWDGDFFTLGDDYGFYTDGGNCYVEADGFYTVYVDLVNNIIAVEPAAVYGIGDCFGGWDIDVEANKFVADGRTLVSPLTVAESYLRMYVDAPSIIDGIEWWQMEFNIYDGAIVYRGDGGDQDFVQVAEGQQVTLDFNAGKGYIGAERIYLEEVNYTLINNDTIFMSASAGRTNRAGWVYSNRPWTVTADADWLLVRKNESNLYDNNFTSGYEYEDLFMIYAQANETAEERIGHVTIATEDNVSKTFVVVQRPYTLSFNEEEYINGLRFDGEPVDTFVIEGAWDWDNIYYNLYPNHGWQVTSYPDWMVMDEFAHNAANCDFETILANEDILAAGQPIISTVVFRFERNESPEPREAYITFEGHGQKAVGIFRQEGLNEQAIFSGAQALAKKMYIYDEALGMGRHTDYGFPSFMLSMDSRGIDMICGAIGYNWYSSNEGFSDLGSNLVYTAQFWNTMYNHIGMANGVIRAYANRAGDPLFQFYLGQAYAFRAFNYFYLAQTYQHTYVGNEEAPCVPIITDANMDVVNAEGCPRASVREVYDFILSDLDKALTLLQQSGLARPSKNLVSPEVVYGLRARVNMVRGEWAAAAQDAQRVIEAGVAAPYTMDELRAPSLHDINHEAWLWGIDAEETDSPVQTGICNWPSHMGSFSTGYAQVGAWRRVSPALYQAIPDTDVRQGWFLNDQRYSANLSEEQRAYVNDNGMPAYTQVKFAPYNNELGVYLPASDIPLMRIEEMHLILAEAQAMMGDVDAGAKTLINFVSNYRDNAYDCNVRSAEQLQEEVWLQRRIEFWGEGHAYFDLMRLGKGVNRRGAGFSEEFTFDIPAGDAALIFPIPDREMNRNPQLEQNPVAEQPKPLPSEWEAIGTGVYTHSIFVSGTQGNVISRHRDDATQYRLSNWGIGGLDFYFTWTEDGVIKVESQPIGYVHSSYGDVYVMSVDDYVGEETAPSYYDAETRTIYFGVVYYVSAGVFGYGYETFTLDEAQAEAYSRSRERSVKESKLLVLSRELVTDLDAKLQVK